MILRLQYRDSQDVAPVSYCEHCFAELYEYDDDDLCPQCKEEENERDSD